MSMCREILAMVTEGVVHRVYKVVTWSYFGVIQRHKVSGFTTVSQVHIRTPGADFMKGLRLSPVSG